MDLEKINRYLKAVEESETTAFSHTGRLKVGLDLGTTLLAGEYAHKFGLVIEKAV